MEKKINYFGKEVDNSFKKFPWGKVLERISVDMDGKELLIIKYVSNFGNTDGKTLYHVDGANISDYTLEGAIINAIAHKVNPTSGHHYADAAIRVLGLNNGS